MKIGCMCVSEYRSQIFGIGYSAYIDQTHEDKVLHLLTPDRDTADYDKVLARHDARCSHLSTPLRGIDTVEDRMDEACRHIFEDLGCDAAAIWDDDDWKHPSLLSQASEVLAEGSYLVAGFLAGHFVNLRTLWAERAMNEKPWGFWGGSIVFMREAWEYRKWKGLGFPASDRAFCEAVGGSKRQYWAPPLSEDPFRMLAFCHGRNICQKVRGGGFDLKPWLKKNMSSHTLSEIFRSQKFLEDNNINPPQVDLPY